MPKKYIKAGVPAGDLYDVVNALTGAQEDGSQGDATLGPNGEIAIDKDGNITMNPPDGSVHATVDNAIKLNNQPASYYAKATDAFATYTHSFSGGVHNLTGSGDNIKFISVADYNGEPIKINGTTCTARTISGDAIWAGFFKRDNMVTCFKKGTILNFNGGGLASSEVAKLTPENIKTGVNIVANGKTISGNFTADGNVAANEILNGKVAYSRGQRIVGQIPSKGGESFRPTTYDQTINAGQYLSGNQIIQGDWNLRSENIKSGATIFGVRGNYDVSQAGYFASTPLRSGGTFNDFIEVNTTFNKCRAMAKVDAPYYYATVRITVWGWNGNSWVEIFKQEDYVGTTTNDYARASVNQEFYGYSRYRLNIYTDKDTFNTSGFGCLQGY